MCALAGAAMAAYATTLALLTASFTTRRAYAAVFLVGLFVITTPFTAGVSQELAAISAVGLAGSQDAVRWIAPRLQDEERDVRLIALEWIGTYHVDAAAVILPTITAVAMRDADETVRGEAEQLVNRVREAVDRAWSAMPASREISGAV